MTQLLIDYFRPNGEPLRPFDFGTEFMASEGISPEGILQPLRDEAECKRGETGDVYFAYQRLALPLPDGFDTVLRVMGISHGIPVRDIQRPSGTNAASARNSAPFAS
jgi:hypothetical protein